MDTIMESAAAATTDDCEIARLPVDLISASIARTGPLEACRAAVVSPAFRKAADSDIVWNCFLPSNLPSLALGELTPPPSSKKELFMRLSDGPVLLADGLMSMWLVKKTGAVCYLLSARKLIINWTNTPTKYRWVPIIGSSIFSDAAMLWRDCRLEMHGKIDSSMLSKNTRYTAYIVMGVHDRGGCCSGSSQKMAVTISLGGRTSTRDVLIDTQVLHSWQMRRGGVSIPTTCGAIPGGTSLSSLRRTDGGWVQLELGDFYNGDGDDGEVSISILDTSLLRRSGLIVLGIEIIAN